MRETTAVGIGWKQGRCVTTPIYVNYAVGSVVKFCLLNVCAVWPCVVNCGMGCWLSVARPHLCDLELVSVRHWVVHTRGHQGIVSLVSPWCVPFEPSHALPWAWLEFKGAAVSVA